MKTYQRLILATVLPALFTSLGLVLASTFPTYFAAFCGAN